MTNSSGTNLDMRSMPERSSPWMDLINGAEAGMPNHRDRQKQGVDEEIPQGQITAGRPLYILSSVIGASLHHSSW